MYDRWLRSDWRIGCQADGEPSARRYAQTKYRLLLIDLAARAAFLIVFQWCGASLALARGVSDVVSASWLLILGYLAVMGTLAYLLALPLHFYGSFLLERRFTLSRLTIKGWVIREIKQLVIGGVLSAVVIEGFYGILRAAPDAWPLWATVGWIGFTVVLARVFPTILLPVFYRTRPLEHEELVKRLLALCQRAGCAALGVFRFDLGVETRKANAALAGLGKTRRVLVSDTLVERFSSEEIEGVLAHELGHQRYRHIIKLLALSAFGSWLAFTFTKAISSVWVTRLELHGLADIAGFPVLALWWSFLGLASLPIHNRPVAQLPSL